MTRLLLLTLLAGAASAQGMPLIKAEPAHELLEKQIGTWDVVQNIWHKPDAPPMSRKGTFVVRAIVDGLGIAFEYTSPGDDKAPGFHGHGVTVWVPVKKHYEGYWFDNMSVAGMAHSTGTFDAKTKTISERMTGVEPNGSPSTFDVITVVESDDKHVQSFFVLKDGKRVGKMMELTYTRAAK